MDEAVAFTGKIPGLDKSRPFYLLTRHFFRQFFHNDLISPHTGTGVALTHVLALLMVPGIFISLRLVRKYAFLLAHFPLSVHQEATVGDKFFFLSFSMIVIGFVTVLEWDTLLPNRRDYNILVPLPIQLRTLFASKGLALILLLLLFTLAVNGISTVLFPLVVNSNMGSLLHEGWFILEPGEREQIREQATLAYAGWFILSHALSVAAGNAFVFLSAVSVQGVLVNWFSGETFRRISRALQLLLMVLLLSVFCLLPKIIFTFDSLKHNELFQTLFPPMWYLGLYQALLGSGEFQSQGDVGLRALALTVVCSLLTYLVACKRQARRSLESMETVPQPAKRLRFMTAVLNRLLVRNGAERATFYFVVKTLLRSQKHRLYWGGYLSVGMALVIVALMDVFSRPVSIDWDPLSLSILSMPLVLSFFVLTGMRFIFTVPAELRANWVFRLAENHDRASSISGVHKAMLVIGILPLFSVLFPSYLLLWDSVTALLHLAYGVVLSLILVEILLFKFPKIPFTCSYLPGKANLKGFWFIYLLFFVTYAYTMAQLEAWMLGNPFYFSLFYALAIPLLFTAVTYRNRLWKSNLAFIYDETAEPAVRTLDLSD